MQVGFCRRPSQWSDVRARAHRCRRRHGRAAPDRGRGSSARNPRKPPSHVVTARLSSQDDSQKDQTRRDIMLLALTGAAGSLDAIGFLALGHVFTANMTGNTVLLGLHVAQEQGAAAVRSLVALLGFGVGLVIGALIVERSADATPWPKTVTHALALEVVILAVFAIGSYL